MTTARARPHRSPRARAARAGVAVLLAAWAAAAAARGGAYRSSAHGDPVRGVLRTPSAKRGACVQCHARSATGTTTGPTARGRVAARSDRGLFAANDAALCFSCHKLESGTFLGEHEYETSAHATSTAATWPGPTPRARSSADAGKCVNCHDPHGAKDAQGPIPSMLHVRGPALCLTCHDGSPASKDVAAELRQPYRHPLRASRDPAKPATGETCDLCHDPHASSPSVATTAYGTRAVLRGAPRVRVSNGAAGTEPIATALPSDDPGAGAEHEVCFGCHATRAPGATLASVAAQTNPANASFHPVQALGRNVRIDPGSFVNGWADSRLVACSDCHSGDGGRVRGPHGSSYPHLLRKRSPTAARQPMAETDLCFECHAYRTYADPSSAAAHALSRFQPHAAHASRGVTCAACHAAHGSATLPALLAVGPLGLSAYEALSDGGRCTTTCHTATPPSGSYRVSYGR